MDSSARDQQGVGGQDDDSGQVLNNAYFFKCYVSWDFLNIAFDRYCIVIAFTKSSIRLFPGISYLHRKSRSLRMQTGFSETLIGWKPGITTNVPLWDRMEGALLWTQIQLLDFLLFIDISSAICFAVECWNKLDGNVGELSSWVQTKVSAQEWVKVEIFINYCTRTEEGLKVCALCTLSKRRKGNMQRK